MAPDITPSTPPFTQDWKAMRVAHMAAAACLCVGLAWGDTDCRIDGDFDDNGVVDLDDYRLFAEHYGRAVGEIHWDAEYDMDRDGRVGLDDFFLFADCFGMRQSPRLDFQVLWPEVWSPRKEYAVASPSSGMVSVQGCIRVPCTPYLLAADLVVSADTLVIDVLAQPAGSGCLDSVEDISYTAQVSCVPPGRWLVRMQHRYTDLGEAWVDEVVHEDSIVVVQ